MLMCLFLGGFSCVGMSVYACLFCTHVNFIFFLQPFLFPVSYVIIIIILLRKTFLHIMVACNGSYLKKLKDEENL